MSDLAVIERPANLITSDRVPGQPLAPADVISPKQLHFLRNSSQRVNVLEGSIRSGKTIISLLRWLIYIARAPLGGELVMIGRTRDAIWRNCVGPLQNVALFGPIAWQVVGNYGAPTVKILGRVVHILGASDAKAEKVIRGMTVAGAYVDEITVIPEEFFTQLLGRMSVPRAKLFGTSNPDNPAHWLKTKFLDRIAELADWCSWHFTLDDNPALTESYKASIRAEFTGLWYRRFILGEWVAAEGAVFPMWDPDKHVVEWGNLPHMQRLLCVGVDYGTNNPTAALLLGLSRELDPKGNLERQRLYLVDEWGTAKGHGLDDLELSRRLRAWMDTKHLPAQHLEPEWLIVDPSAASFKARLYLDGLSNLVNADNDVEYGLKTMAGLLANGNLLVSDRCKGFIQEVTGYSWDEKKAREGKDVPVKVADHFMDAGRYSITTTENQWAHLLTT